MKHIKLTRYYIGDVTLGFLKIKGVEHLPIFTLENPWLDNTPNISCIPCGTYDCAPYVGNKYKDVYEVKNVKNRSFILFHKGNYEKDTRGCILPGLGVSVVGPEKMVTNSTSAMNELKRLIGKDEFELEIVNI